MYAFTYVKPSNLAEALSALAAEDAQAVAGGQTLVPTLKQRLARPSALVDIAGLSELKGVSAGGGRLTIGAATRHVEVERSPEVTSHIPALAALAGKIGDPQVRNRGTIGGSVANNDPAACYPAALMALRATVATSKGRDIAAADFFQGLYETALDEGELVTAVSFSVPQKAAWMKFAQPASRFSLVGVFVAQFADGVEIGVTGASENGVFKETQLSAALGGVLDPSRLDGVSVSASGMINDLHGTPDYRANLIRVLTQRAVAQMA